MVGKPTRKRISRSCGRYESYGIAFYRIRRGVIFIIRSAVKVINYFVGVKQPLRRERNGIVVFPLRKRFENVAVVVFPTDESITVALGCGRNKRSIVSYVLRFACKRFSAVYVESRGVDVGREYRIEYNVFVEPVRESCRRRADYG